MAIKIEPYQRQVMTPSVLVSDGQFRVADLSAPYAALADAGDVITRTAQREQYRRDDLDLMDFERQLGEIDTELMVGTPEAPGALKQMGVQAEDVRGRTLSTFDQRTKGLTPKLRTADARAKAQRMLSVRREDADRRLVTHEFDQGKVADDQRTAAAVTGYRNEAIANADDPTMVDAAIARMAGARGAYGTRMGEAPELTAQKIAEQASTTLKDVMAAQITRDPIKALETYKVNANRLLGQDALDVERALQPYVMDVQSRAIGDSLYAGAQPAVAVGSGSLYDAIALTESGNRQFDDAGRPIRGPMTATGERAVGAFQIMPATGPEAARLAGERWDPARLAGDADYNSRLGRAYLDAQVKRFKGNIPVVAAAYNMGPAAAEKWAAGVPYQTASGKTWTPKAPMDLDAMPSETRAYIAKVTKRMGGEAPRVAPGDASTMDGIDTREVAAIRRADQIADPRLRQDALQRIGFLAGNDRKLLQERLRSAELSKAEFTNHYNNTIAKLSDGVAVPIAEQPTQEQLQVAYGAAEGDRRYREMQTYAAAAPVVDQLKTATVSEAAPLLERFKPDPKSDNYAFEAKFYDGIRTAWGSVQKQRNADPAQFLLTNSKAVATKYASVTQAQADMLAADSPEDQQVAAANLASRGQAFTDFMMAEQERMGVPVGDRKLLPVESVKRITGEFDAKVAAGDVQGAANLVRANVASFGDGAAVAITQLGANAGPVLRMALEGIDPRTIETFVAAAGQGDKVVKDSVGNDKWNEMQTAVREQLAALDATGTSEYPAYYDMTLKVAGMKVRAGMAPAVAAQQAAAEIINGRYLFAGTNDRITYRVPLATPQGNPIDAPAVARSAERTLGNIGPADIALGDPPPPGVPEDLYRKYRIERIRETGQWRTLGNESGLELTYQDDGGRLVPVRRADGTPWRMTWADLAAGGEVAVADPRVSGIRSTGKL